MAEKEMNNKIKCTCGERIDPPVLPSKLRYGNLEGSFSARLETKCGNCGKIHFTRYNGRIEKEKI